MDLWKDGGGLNLTTTDGKQNKNAVFAVFKMISWRRELSPIEIFSSIEEAKIFIEKNLNNFISSEVEELRIYMRNSTDWVKLTTKEIQ
jgi:hypothetical protein